MLVLAGPFAAHAAVPEASGYWWRLQTGSGPALPPPGNVPEGGLWVANDVNGAQALSAVRYRAASQEVITSLVLHEASSPSGDAVLLACPITASWTPAQAGAWKDAPKYDCGITGVPGHRGSDGTWTFDVAGVARSGVLNVAVIPGSTAIFSVSFAAPGPDTVVTERATPSPSSTPSASPGPTARPSSPLPRASVLADKTAGDIGAPQQQTPDSTPAAPAPVESSTPEPAAPDVLAAPPPQRFDPGGPGRRWLWGLGGIPVLVLVTWMIRVGRYPIVPPPTAGPDTPTAAP